jgi:hypothetical protein
MPSTLGYALSDLVWKVARETFQAIPSVYVQELVCEVRTPPRCEARPPEDPKANEPMCSKVKASGRLALRAHERIAKRADIHVLKAKDGMRWGDIPQALKLDLEHQTFRPNGVRRSTLHSAA